LKKAIEYNGTYWHSQPYKIVNDNIKMSVSKEIGVDLMVIKEVDWFGNKDKCLDNIRNFIKKCRTRAYNEIL